MACPRCSCAECKPGTDPEFIAFEECGNVGCGKRLEFDTMIPFRVLHNHPAWLPWFCCGGSGCGGFTQLGTGAFSWEGPNIIHMAYPWDDARAVSNRRATQKRVQALRRAK